VLVASLRSEEKGRLEKFGSVSKQSPGIEMVLDYVWYREVQQCIHPKRNKRKRTEKTHNQHCSQIKNVGRKIVKIIGASNRDERNERRELWTKTEKKS
jgi:hypothetical protein